MDTVINAVKFLLLAGVGLACLLGQGWLVVGPLLHGSLIRRKNELPDVALASDRPAFLPELPLMLVSGLILNFAVSLAVQSVTISLGIGAVLALGGAACFAFSIWRGPARPMPAAGSLKTYFALACVCLLYLGPILADPLNDWDARSIWFLHAKMIFTAGSLGLAAGWQHPSVIFSHVDYPNLIPSLAAQVAQVMGLWNEYLPKFSLFFLLVPAVAWLFTFARRSFSFAMLLLLIPFGFSNWLWNGYMDGYLALYFAIGMLLLGRYLKSSRPIDIISSAACFSLLLSIKNEGALAVIAGLGAMLLIVFLKRKSIALNNIQFRHGKYVLAGIFVLVPFILWSADKSQWNLQNDLGIGTSQSYARIAERGMDGSYKVILKSIFKQNEGALLLLGTVFAACAAWNKKFPTESLPALAAAGLYALGMLAIYLLTPVDLAWQINTSIERTMLAVSGCLFVGSYFILNAVEAQ